MYSRFRPVLLLLAIWLLAACVTPPIRPETAPAAAPLNPAVEGNRQLLARWLHIDPATVAVVNTEAVEWPDACLGVLDPLALCAAVMTPGYRITLTANGETYTLHTDQGGGQTRVAAAPEPAIGERIITWTGSDDQGACLESFIGADGVGFGPCQLPKIGGEFATAARQAVLAEFAGRYASFAAETPAGKLNFIGYGAETATAADQEQLARWAQQVTLEAKAGESLAGLRYEGPAEFGSTDTSKCAVLQLGTPIEAGIGACDGSLTNKDMGKATYLEWEALRDRFAPFVLETATERLTFEGMGGESNAAWQRAILAWARTKHAELAGNRISATTATALSWNIGQDMTQKNICWHLTVLNYGYAYAEERLCEGGDLVSSLGSWLTTDELTPFDTWLYERAPFSRDNHYIDGKGTQELSAAEFAEADAWASALWTRIRTATSGFAPEPVTGPCPEARDDLATVRDFTKGFCLLVPATYTVFDPTPTEIVLAKESLLNVTEPRLSIVVTAAAGRTAEQVADEIEAEMQNFAIKRSTAEVAGQPAVILNEMPGQDLNRRVLIVQNDRLYDLTFAPLDHPEIEAFYQAIISDFTLIEPE